MSKRITAIVVWLALASTSSVGRASQDTVAQSSSPAVTVHMRITPITSVAESRWSAEAISMVGAAGIPQRPLLLTGGRKGDRTFCSGILSGSREGDAAYGWTGEVSLKSAAIDRIELTLTWARYEGNVLVKSETRELSLKEHASYPLDFVSSGEVGRCAGGTTYGALIELSAEILEEGTVGNTILGYDVWREDQDGSLTPVTAHTTASARQGETAEFWFAPVLSPTPDGCHVEINVSGSIRGHLRRDGTIEMAVVSARDVNHIVPYARSARTWGPLSGERGQKAFTVAAGDAVRLTLPPIQGSTQLPCAERFTRPTLFDITTAMATHRTSVIVRPTVRYTQSQ